MWLKLNTTGTRRFKVGEAGMTEPVEVSDRGTFQVSKAVGKKLLGGLADVQPAATENGEDEDE